MRWIWIDTFTEFESGKKASAVKNVTLAEEHVHDYAPAYPLLPPPLMIEGMAQTAGILVGETRGFRENVILAKIRRAVFDDYGRPGDRLTYTVVLDSIDDTAAMTHGEVFRNGDKIGEVDLIFSHVGQSSAELELPSHNFVFGDTFLDLLKNYRIRVGD
ncbi:MAG: beta-hydroxyacyl-ACP dehydratase [Phycisphaerae bacterium]|nr:beta-hydroxyacyl-ACP dehydratase [Phycisphaerae bacterium]